MLKFLRLLKKIKKKKSKIFLNFMFGSGSVQPNRTEHGSSKKLPNRTEPGSAKNYRTELNMFGSVRLAEHMFSSAPL